MAKFLLTHALPSPIPLAQAEAVAKAAKAQSNSDAYWIGSWVQLDDKGDISKIICEWDAKDVDSLNKPLKQIVKAFPGIPVDGPYPMMKVDGESYR
ncbi:MAG TPA: hypothetical protein ENO17_04560 [Candidatus Atribacteria bacterium]|nr:hypothetical protein [Candidatus Atribacteria bacterium]